MTAELRKTVNEFYSKVATTNSKVQEENVSCDKDVEIPKLLCGALSKIHPDVIAKSIGCGMPFPDAVENCSVLDLGSGAGRDVFALSYLVGPKGKVTGVDMNSDMLEASRKLIPYHAELYGYGNVEFKEGYLESLNAIQGLEKESFDIAVSNCVICLCSDKTAVLRQVFQLLKPGGEMCFSDVYADQPLDEATMKNGLIWNEGFGGAYVWKSFKDLVAEIGFLGPFVLNSKPYGPKVKELCDLLAGKTYHAKTLRLIKPAGNSGQVKLGISAMYLGTIPGCEDKFKFSSELCFKKDEPVSINEMGENAAKAIQGSRFAQHFEILT